MKAAYGILLFWLLFLAMIFLLSATAHPQTTERQRELLNQIRENTYRMIELSNTKQECKQSWVPRYDYYYIEDNRGYNREFMIMSTPLLRLNRPIRYQSNYYYIFHFD